MAKKNLTDMQEDSDIGRSQSSMSFQRIRSDILHGRHPPGERLKISELAASLNVSPGAVREALSRLSSEQLVISRDQRGFTVAPLSLDELEDLTDLRCEIEEIALRRSVARGDVDWEAGILAAGHRLQSTPLLTDDDFPTLAPEWLARHAAFHAALVSACGSKKMLELHASLHEQSERYRGLSVDNVERTKTVPKEHQELVEAALARDADKLVALLLSHLRKTTKFIIAKMLAAPSEGQGQKTPERTNRAANG